MRTAIFVVPALLTSLTTAQSADKPRGDSSTPCANGEAKAKNNELADAFDAGKQFAGAYTYLASDYITPTYID
ncbi:hypothetical protein QBC39DRAFT_340965 [Podospora conica]|nr:hypothetical protein QBC39DRAFT_340965 [Schizothecium conicum]